MFYFGCSHCDIDIDVKKFLLAPTCLADSFFPEWLFGWMTAVPPQCRRNRAHVPHGHGFLINSFNNELTDEQGLAELFVGA